MRDDRAVLVVGAASRDLDPTDPRGWRLGGGATYSALTLARLGVPTRAVIGVDDEAHDAPEVRLLEDAGAVLALHRLASGPVFENRELPQGRVQTALSDSAPIPVGALPRAWTTSQAWLFAPVADEVPESWADVPGADDLVVLGWQGLLRDITAGEPVIHRAPGPSRLVARADLLGVGSDDLSPGTDLANLGGLLRPGAWVVLTRSDAGGLLLRNDGSSLRPQRRYPAVAATPRDPTGAGDAFLAALVAARLGAGPGPARERDDASFPSPEDLRFAATVAALAVEGHGLDGVPDASAVRRRLREQVMPG